MPWQGRQGLCQQDLRLGPSDHSSSSVATIMMGQNLPKLLADELFGGQGSFINFDLLEYTDSHSVSRLLGLPTIYSEGDLDFSGLLTDSSRLLTEAVKRNPFIVVLFSNIDVAHASVIDILIEISSRGAIANGQGSIIDFKKTLIIMTSTIGTDKPVASLTCKCFQKVEECPIKELLAHHPYENRHRCDILSRLEKVHKRRKDELFKQLDDIVLSSGLQLQHCKAIARLQLCWTYILWTALWWTGGEKLVKVWLEKNLNPVLHEMCAKGEIEDSCIIYIDTLVGTDDLSYRVVKREDFVVHRALKVVKESSAELRALCRKGKERIKWMYLLRRKLYELDSSASVDAGTDFGCVDRAIGELAGIIDILINEIDVNHMADKEKVNNIFCLRRSMNGGWSLVLGKCLMKGLRKGLSFLKQNCAVGCGNKQLIL